MVDITRVILIGDAPPHLEAKGAKIVALGNVVLATDYREQVCLFLFLIM